MKRRILVVEDDANIALTLTHLFEREGYDVAVAHDGEAALASVAASAPHLVVLDLMLPGKDGFEVCRALRAGPHSGIRIVIVTAKGHASDVGHAIALGADAYMTKPFSTKELVARVRALLPDA